MPSVTLVESAKLSQDQLVQGLIENIVTTNQVFAALPFDEIEGNALAYNRENALGDTQFAGVGTVITAKAAATFTKVTSELTTIVGDAEVNGLIQATRSNINDQKAIQVASKVKSAARRFQDTMITGDGTGNAFSGLLTLVPAGQIVGANSNAANGGPLAFADLDLLLDMVKDKDGRADFLMASSRTLRSFRALLRAAGGNNAADLVTLPDGSQILSYNGVPFYRNDWIPTNQTKGATTTCTTVFAGTFDDGSRTHGIAGLTATGAAGLRVEEVGVSETKDETITRVKWYAGLALFSELGIAALNGVNN